MPSVRDNADRQRFEILVDDVVAGFVIYRRRDDLIALVHTEIDRAYEGQGLGSQLARHVLDAVRAEGLKVLPLCPFILAYIERHAEYGDLVAATQL